MPIRPARIVAGVALLAAASAVCAAPIKYNREELVELAVQGQISPPVLRSVVYRVEADGNVRMLPGTGGITYNFRTGDSAVHMAGNHVEPAVSIFTPGPENKRDSRESRALNALSAIGNRVRVIDGDAKGATGRVVGKHGGIEHVMVDFPDEVYDRLAIGDRIQVRTIGAGMALSNVNGVRVMNASPDLIDALNARGAEVTDDGRLRVGVTRRIPARVMGSGLGQDQVYTGDYDIQLFDRETVAKHGLESLRFGDIVAIVDADHSYGRIYRKGAVSVGVVVHGRSDSAGHGPGVATLFTSTEGLIELYDDPDANLVNLIEIE